MTPPNYDLVGKRVRAHLYDHSGRLIGSIEGRVADVAAAVPVGKDAAGNEIKKDLAYVVDIEPLVRREDAPDGEVVPFTNSAGAEGEGWFAVHDLTVVRDGPPLSTN